MPKLTPEDLSRLYPTPKPQQEIDDARKARRQARQPKYVPLKISIWSTLFFISIIGCYFFISAIMASGFVTFADALVGLSLSGIVIGITLAICFYSYASITETAYESFGSTSEVLLTLTIISLGCLALISTIFLQIEPFMTIVAAAIVDVTISFLAIHYIKRRNDKLA